MARPLVLAGPARLDGARVTDRRVARLLQDGHQPELARFLPPFAVIGLAEEGLRVATDRMGMSQVFLGAGPGWEAVSTSARLLHLLLDQGLDEEAVLLQSQLGWQLFEHTLYSGVTKLAPGESLTITDDGVRRRPDTDGPAAPGSTRLGDAVDRASTTLRRFTTALLEDTDDPVLQLTGGMDSRIILSSVPAARRAGLRAMTLDVPGSRDTSVAGAVAVRYGLTHQVVTLDGLRSVSAGEWFDRVRSTAAAHDGMLNPVAKAATEWAEESVDQGSRLGGLGGEVARGFYYVGPVRPAPVDRRRSDRLARWRMLANEAVAPEALHTRYRRAAEDVALDAIHAALVAGGSEWFSATDDLYYRHRMPRWAGLAETVASTSRTIVNPMLDPAFIRVARDLAPRDKGHARFLARLQLELDPALAALPLEGRPAPETFAYPGPLSLVRRASTQSRLGIRKVKQRATRARRPPAGGNVVATAVTHHVREHPALLGPVRDAGWFDQGWLTDVLSGSVNPAPHTVAFLMNMLVALDARNGPR
ncbi:hypothetical protein [Ornithinimicrobium sp. CNJ-824]|uniref:hypothetical protein n=1 Tax=Ornithinimicrobium sp. CNJ-824 TaxID=1904966 RepID=UPI00117D829A|nr:hypothetical protein [Ornithinimicrobium sp. CNJ-824]